MRLVSSVARPDPSEPPAERAWRPCLARVFGSPRRGARCSLSRRSEATSRPSPSWSRAGRPGVLAFLRRMLGDAEDARDVAQLTFVRVWENLEPVRPRIRVLDVALSHRQQPRDRRAARARDAAADRGRELSPREGRAHERGVRTVPPLLHRDEVRRVFEACAGVLSARAAPRVRAAGVRGAGTATRSPRSSTAASPPCATTSSRPAASCAPRSGSGFPSSSWGGRFLRFGIFLLRDRMMKKGQEGRDEQEWRTEGAEAAGRRGGGRWTAAPRSPRVRSPPSVFPFQKKSLLLSSLPFLLSPSLSSELKAHLATCASCAAEARRARPDAPLRAARASVSPSRVPAGGRSGRRRGRAPRRGRRARRSAPPAFARRLPPPATRRFLSRRFLQAAALVVLAAGLFGLVAGIRFARQGSRRRRRASRPPRTGDRQAGRARSPRRASAPPAPDRGPERTPAPGSTSSPRVSPRSRASSSSRTRTRTSEREVPLRPASGRRPGPCEGVPARILAAGGTSSARRSADSDGRQGIHAQAPHGRRRSGGPAPAPVGSGRGFRRPRDEPEFPHRSGDAGARRADQPGRRGVRRPAPRRRHRRHAPEVGGRRRGGPAEKTNVSEEIRGIGEKLKKLFNVTDFTRLDSVVVRGVEGQRVAYVMGGGLPPPVPPRAVARRHAGPAAGISPSSACGARAARRSRGEILRTSST